MCLEGRERGGGGEKGKEGEGEEGKGKNKVGEKEGRGGREKGKEGEGEEGKGKNKVGEKEGGGRNEHNNLPSPEYSPACYKLMKHYIRSSHRRAQTCAPIPNWKANPMWFSARLQP